MTARRELRARAWASASACVGLILSRLSPGGVRAADLTSPAPPVSPPEAASRWYVKLGAVGVINQSTSNLYAQPLAGVVVPGLGFVPTGGVGPQLHLAGSNAQHSNLFTIVGILGYSITSDLSIETATGAPTWEKVRITGFTPGGPAAGTLLFEALPATVPITAVYHFRQLGALQPYLGAGVAPVFTLSTRSEFNTGISIEPTAGLVLQGGFDYMFNPHWGVYFDVKKIFAQFDVNTRGINLGPPIGGLPVAASSRTTAEPWLLSSGVMYRF